MSTSKTCPRCGQEIGDRPQLPVAERLYIDFCGRMLYRIDGMAGLFLLHGRHDTGKPFVMAKRDGRGVVSRTVFVRATEAEERLLGAMGLQPVTLEPADDKSQTEVQP